MTKRNIQWKGCKLKMDYMDRLERDVLNKAAKWDQDFNY